MPLDIVKYSPRVQKIFRYKAYRGAQGPLTQIWDPPKISETTRAKILKLKAQLDIAKYSLWVQKFLR